MCTKLCRKLFHDVLGLSCEPAECQCCTTTATVVVYCSELYFSIYSKLPSEFKNQSILIRVGESGVTQPVVKHIS